MTIDIRHGDCRQVLATLPAESVNCIVTSPPYFGLRDYGVDGQIGLEQTPDAFVAEMVAVFREARRVLRDDGTLWLNLGDSYAANRPYQVASTKGGAKHGPGQAAGGKASQVPDGLKPKDLIGIPWRVAFALQADGWYLRQDIIWAKPNPMPESVRDRCTKAHEYIFLLSKSASYFYDVDAVMEDVAPATIARLAQNVAAQKGSSRVPGKTNGTMKAVGRSRGVPPRHAQYGSSDQSGLDSVGRGLGRNRRSVWNVSTKPFKEAHFATFPPDLIEPCVMAGCPAGGTVLDPFFGAGTTGLVAQRHDRNCIGIELNPAYIAIAQKRLGLDAGVFA